MDCREECYGATGRKIQEEGKNSRRTSSRSYKFEKLSRTGVQIVNQKPIGPVASAIASSADPHRLATTTLEKGWV